MAARCSRPAPPVRARAGRRFNERAASRVRYAPARSVSDQSSQRPFHRRPRRQPSEAAIAGDAVRFYDWLAARPEVDPQRIVFQGASLGGAVATALAQQRRPAALVLECTFTSMAALAHEYGLPGFLCRNPFATDRVLPTLPVPIAIFHGWRDHTIPVAHGRRLHALVPESRYTELPCGHDDFYNDWENVRAFLIESGVLLAE